jgi:hypothetical protein
MEKISQKLSQKKFLVHNTLPPGEAREDFVFVPCNFLIPLVVVSPSITYVLQHEVVCHNTLLGLIDMAQGLFSRE